MPTPRRHPGIQSPKGGSWPRCPSSPRSLSCLPSAVQRPRRALVMFQMHSAVFCRVPWPACARPAPKRARPARVQSRVPPSRRSAAIDSLHGGGGSSSSRARARARRARARQGRGRGTGNTNCHTYVNFDFASLSQFRHASTSKPPPPQSEFGSLGQSLNLPTLPAAPYRLIRPTQPACAGAG